MVERDGQAPAGNLGLHVDIAHQRDALAGFGGADQQHVIVEGRAPFAAFVGGQAERTQPQRPIAAIGILQKRVPQAVGRRSDRRTAGKQSRARDRQQHGRGEVTGGEPRVLAQTVADRDVDAVATQIHQGR